MASLKLTKVIGILIFTSLQISAQQYLNTTSTVAASGRVIDARSGLPIRGATVGMFCQYLEGHKPGCAKDQKAVADTAGYFVFPVAPPGQYLLIAFADGFESVRGKPEVSIAIQDGHKTQESTLILVPTGRITGSVVDRSGKAEVGVKVAAWKEDGVSHKRTLVSETQTGSSGTFSLEYVSPGDLTIVVGTDGKIFRRVQLSPGKNLQDVLFKEQ